MRTDQTSKRRNVTNDELKKEIMLLTKKIDFLMTMLDEEESLGPGATEIEDDVQIGDYVMITNDYMKMFGQRGKVIGTTRTQVSIRLTSGRIVNRKKTNVTLI